MLSFRRLFYLSLVVVDVALAACSAPPAPAEPTVASRLVQAQTGGGQKSLYVNADLNANSPIRSYAILPAPTFLQYQATSNTTGYGGVGLAIDTDSETLFVTFEGYGWLKIVDARTLVVPPSSVTAPGASNLAGIVMDQGKQKLYTVDRSTNRLYVYTWNAVARTLTLDGGTYRTLPGVGQAYGIALDELRDELYVADVASTVKVFDTGTWSLARTVSVPSQRAMGVAIDEVRRFMYTGNAYEGVGCNGMLSQVNLDTGAEHTFNVRAYTGAPGECVVGLAVDLDTGLVYITTGNQGAGGSDRIMVFDQTLAPLYQTGDIGSPTGIVVPRAAITYNPLNLTKSDGQTGCVAPGTQLDYAIGYNNANAYQVSNVTITDTLPPEVEFVSASDGGTAVGNVVTWSLGTLAPGAAGTLHLIVSVRGDVAQGAEINNTASIDCDQTGAAFALDRTDVCANQPPVAVALPDSGVFECTSPAGALVTLDGSQSSDPDPGDTLSYLWECAVPVADPTAPITTGQFPLGSHLACLTVTDSAGASDSDDAHFAVVDTTPPALVCPPDQTVEVDAQCAAYLGAAATVNDVCDPHPAMTSTPPAGALLAMGPNPVVFTAADASGNAASCTSTITVVDTTPPVIACNAYDIFPSDAPITFTATVEDACGGATVAITGFDCWGINGAGRKHSKLESCIVGFQGAGLTVTDAGGVGDHIDWTVTATDASGNTTSKTCSIVVLQNQSVMVGL